MTGARRQLGDDHPTTLTSISNLGKLLRSQGKLDEAEPLLREVLEDQGKGDEAEALLRHREEGGA